MLGLLLHWRPRSFLNAVARAVPSTTGVLIQFPLYGGIAAILTTPKGAGGQTVAQELSAVFVHLAATDTYALVIGTYSAILGFFVPSGGGKWLIEAPYVMQAANDLHYNLGWAVQIYNAAEALPNLINPFWMLPLLGVLGLKARDHRRLHLPATDRASAAGADHAVGIRDDAGLSPAGNASAVTETCIPSESAAVSARTRDLLESALVWDNHGCMPLRADASFLPQLRRYRDAGVSIASLNVGFAGMPLAEHLRILSFMRQWIAQRPQQYCLVHTVADVRRCKEQGRLGIVFDIEGMCPVQGDASFVQTFYELGVRWMLIAYNRNNAAGGGCLDQDKGLSAVGRAIIDEMERVGMVLCLSHAGARTAADALEYSRSPAIFSHSNPYGDTPHPRNISDEMMRACASKGGVIGLNGIGPFLGATSNLVDGLLRQLRYAVDLVGAAHVGLSLDFCFDTSELDDHLRLNPALYPPGMSSAAGVGMIEPEAIGAIAEGLARDNLTDAQIRGILGENWLRIATTVWR